MKAIDRYLQRARIAKARAFIKPGDRVLDIGSADGVMFESLRGVIASGVGIDPTLPQKVENNLYSLIPGHFPEACPPEDSFDVITLLAVLEHIPTAQQKSFAEACYAKMRPGGRLVITVPSPRVDAILAVLRTLRLIDGMSLEEHYGFRPGDTPRIFSEPGFRLATHRTFQLGLNNLYVFERPGEPGA